MIVNWEVVGKERIVKDVGPFSTERGYIFMTKANSYVVNTWTQGSSIPYSKTYGYGVESTTDIFVFNYDNGAYKYNGTSFTSMKTMTAECSDTCCASVGTKIYLNQGDVGGGVSQNYAYETTDNTETSKTDDGVARRNGALFNLNGDLYNTVGYKSNALYNTNKYTISSDSWVSKTNATGAMWGSAYSAINNKGYVHKETYFAEYVDDTWTSKTNGPTTKDGGGFTLGNEMFIAGGSPGIKTTNSYSQTANSWTSRVDSGENMVAVAGTTFSN